MRRPAARSLAIVLYPRCRRIDQSDESSEHEIAKAALIGGRGVPARQRENP
jgi:hypothetical protein